MVARNSDEMSPVKTAQLNRRARLRKFCFGKSEGYGHREEGQAAIELALCLPLLLLVVTGIFAFGVAFNNYLMLTDATSQGARILAFSRGQTLDPCATAVNAVYLGAPLLKQSNLTFAFVLNGVAYSGTTCNSASSTTGAAANLAQGKSAKVTVTYPCNLAYYLHASPTGCTLLAQTTELVQ
jgi:Flp pilus assembly protein TadG